MNRIDFTERITDMDMKQCRDPITTALFTLLDIYTNTYSKTMVVRFDLRFPRTYITYDSSSYISIFMKRYIQHLNRKGLSPAYCWVREEGYKSTNPHYHCMVLLDGNRTQRYYQHLQSAEAIWGSVLDTDLKGLVHHCTKDWRGDTQENGIILRSDDPKYEERIETVIRQALYMAKEYTKGLYKDGYRDYGMSRLSSISLLRSRYRERISA